eukprot:COSAG06_NODE_60526_length_270_cov_1.210526_2_plen_43_part_01
MSVSGIGMRMMHVEAKAEEAAELEAAAAVEEEFLDADRGVQRS